MLGMQAIIDTKISEIQSLIISHKDAYKSTFDIAPVKASLNTRLEAYLQTVKDGNPSAAEMKSDNLKALKAKVCALLEITEDKISDDLFSDAKYFYDEPLWSFSKTSEAPSYFVTKYLAKTITPGADDYKQYQAFRKQVALLIKTPAFNTKIGLPGRQQGPVVYVIALPFDESLERNARLYQDFNALDQLIKDSPKELQSIGAEVYREAVYAAVNRIYPPTIHDELANLSHQLELATTTLNNKIAKLDALKAWAATYQNQITYYTELHRISQPEFQSQFETRFKTEIAAAAGRLVDDTADAGYRMPKASSMEPIAIRNLREQYAQEARAKLASLTLQLVSTREQISRFDSSAEQALYDEANSTYTAFTKRYSLYHIDYTRYFMGQNRAYSVAEISEFASRTLSAETLLDIDKQLPTMFAEAADAFIQKALAAIKIPEIPVAPTKTAGLAKPATAPLAAAGGAGASSDAADVPSKSGKAIPDSDTDLAAPSAPDLNLDDMFTWLANTTLAHVQASIEHISSSITRRRGNFDIFNKAETHIWEEIHRFFHWQYNVKESHLIPDDGAPFYTRWHIDMFPSHTLPDAFIPYYCFKHIEQFLDPERIKTTSATRLSYDFECIFKYLSKLEKGKYPQIDALLAMVDDLGFRKNFRKIIDFSTIKTKALIEACKEHMDAFALYDAAKKLLEVFETQLWRIPKNLSRQVERTDADMETATHEANEAGYFGGKYRPSRYHTVDDGPNPEYETKSAPILAQIEACKVKVAAAKARLVEFNPKASSADDRYYDLTQFTQAAPRYLKEQTFTDQCTLWDSAQRFLDPAVFQRLIPSEGRTAPTTDGNVQFSHYLASVKLSEIDAATTGAVSAAAGGAGATNVASAAPASAPPADDSVCAVSSNDAAVDKRGVTGSAALVASAAHAAATPTIATAAGAGDTIPVASSRSTAASATITHHEEEDDPTALTAPLMSVDRSPVYTMAFMSSEPTLTAGTDTVIPAAVAAPFHDATDPARAAAAYELLCLRDAFDNARVPAQTTLPAAVSTALPVSASDDDAFLDPAA